MDRRFWDMNDVSARLHFRARNMVSRATLVMINDGGPVQLHQVEIYPTELHSDVQFPGVPGLVMVPLPGAKATLLHQGGQRTNAAIVAIIDPRYRPTGAQPGESVQYMVDGAGSDGSGGTTCHVIAGRKGKVIDVGDANSVTINVGTAASGVAINMGGSGATVNITGAAGDVVIDGVSLVNHVHFGVTPGDGDSGKPVS